MAAPGRVADPPPPDVYICYRVRSVTGSDYLTYKPHGAVLNTTNTLTYTRSIVIYPRPCYQPLCLSAYVFQWRFVDLNQFKITPALASPRQSKLNIAINQLRNNNNNNSSSRYAIKDYDHLRTIILPPPGVEASF